MNLSPALPRVDMPAFARGLAIVALALGIGVWGALLFAPAPRALPPMLDTVTSEQNTAAVARWFGGGALRVRVALMGLITSDKGGAALLSVNGGTAQAYRVGQTLAPGVTLAGVTANAVSIDQDGVTEQVAMPANPASVVQGFVPVNKSATRH
ncbi:MAG TPA: type II secretion system protein N [Eoetvoesiella sp.]|uniref:type II secretion system protein N n=1 Tax=Eoetvoesiella sp. TaxID=1966355 RepID=UPI002BBC3961|nr:type II secretion system protein N [Eoetvoesiella sp.]HWK62906.1 type II secretion system protein N [Eoetvoesiella sp.]